MTSHKLVIDTNVLISAALSTQGAPAKLVQLALAKHRLVFSQATFDELRTRLYRPKFDRFISLESRERLLHDFKACAHWDEIGVPGLYCRDRDDDQMVEAALQANAAALISGDKDLLDMAAIPGLQVLSPQQAMVFLGA